MSAVDLKALREGDTVLVRMTVGTAGYLRVASYGGGMTTVGIDDQAIVSVEPRPLAVGDIAKICGGSVPLSVLHVRDGKAWVRSGKDEWIHTIADLVRA